MKVRFFALMASMLLMTTLMAQKPKAVQLTPAGLPDELLEHMNGSTKDKDRQKENTKVEGMGAITEGRRMKVRGYRIQVYWGGSQRFDQTKAIRAGSRVTSMFPELQAYTTFESPHWRCRVGDFRERKEAADYLAKLRKAKIEGAMVVKSEILVYPK